MKWLNLQMELKAYQEETGSMTHEPADTDVGLEAYPADTSHVVFDPYHPEADLDGFVAVSLEDDEVPLLPAITRARRAWMLFVAYACPVRRDDPLLPH
jgi:hypothetical protein